VVNKDKPKPTPAPKVHLPSLTSASLDDATPNDVRSLAKTLIAVVDRSYTYIAQLLYRIREEDMYKAYGYTNFGKYVEEELKFGVRKANYLIKIHEKLVKDMGLSTQRLDKIGWSRAKEITGIIDEDNRDEILKDAETLTVEELKVKVRNLKVGSDAVSFHSVRFTFDNDQLDNIDHALEIASEVCKKAGKPSDSKNHLLDMIALEFATSHAAGAAVSSLGTYVSTLERQFNCKILVFNDPSAANMVLELIERQERAESSGPAT